MDEVETDIGEVMDEIIAALTRPVTPDEASPKAPPPEKPARFSFKGNLEEVNRFFYKRGWTDGFPIIPPTEEAVQQMLTGTDLAPDHIVERLLPRMGKATIEKIAINAVMAGALPTYMPVLIAGVHALVDPNSGFGHSSVSTGSFAPFWIINGPLRHDLHVNSGTGALSPGDIANAAIGRAMSLIIKNIGGIRKGIEDMGGMGNVGKYSLVVAENEEESPWAPLHVERGLNKGDSAVTFCAMYYYVTVWHYGLSAEGVFKGLLYNIPPSRTDAMLCWLLNPRQAKLLADAGWTKAEIKRYVVEYARAPAYKIADKYMYPVTKAVAPQNDMDSVAMYSNVDRISIIVTGGYTSQMGLYFTNRLRPLEFITRKVELPANWDKLVRKYRDIVPNYARY